MKSVYTLTLSPVLDVHYALERFTPGEENFAGAQVKLAAGKGVNVSSALLRHGLPAPAYVLLGNTGANEYLSLAAAQGLDLRALRVDSQVREYVSVNYPGGETRICYKNFKATDSDVINLGEKLKSALEPGDIVCVSGGLPAGVTPEAVARLCLELREAGALTALDSAAFSPSNLKLANPWLIKPNLSEARALLSSDAQAPASKNEAAELAAALTEYSENVLLSLGAEGAVFASRRTGKTISKPAVEIDRCHSTVGAGDNLLAGFIHYIVTECPPSGFDPELHGEAALKRGLIFAAEQCASLR